MSHSSHEVPVELTVVMCVYNGAATIEAQLDALAQQVVDFAWEVVVSDNGSTDRTRSLVETRTKGFPAPLRVVDSGARRGLPGARNLGVIASRGRLIAFCDCDDVVGPNWLQGAFDGLQSFDLAGGPTRRLDDPFREDSAFVSATGTYPSQLGLAIRGCNFGVTRRTYFGCGGFDEALPAYGMDDIEFSYRAARSGACVGSAPGMLLYFRETENARDQLRKMYRSAMAELLVWYRFPEDFAERLPLRNLMRELALFVPEHIALARRGELPAPRALVRELVNRVGRVAAHVAWVRDGEVPQPRLLDPSDDRPS